MSEPAKVRKKWGHSGANTLEGACLNHWHVPQKRHRQNDHAKRDMPILLSLPSGNSLIRGKINNSYPLE